MDEKNIDFDKLLEILKQIYADGLPFNRLLGMKIVELDRENVCMEIEMREELVGNFVRGILHGGVISSLIDVVGGLTASVGLLKQLAGESIEEISGRFAKMGTIDLRVDYLRPGYGERFLCRGSILRTGNKVAVTRMEVKNEKDVLIAVGTGTYLVG
jgi:uncharacterized protein (TIGR00369 family)